MIHVLYACNQSYMRQTYISIFSLMKNNKKGNVFVHLVIDKVSKKSITEIAGKIEEYKNKLEVIKMETFCNHVSIKGGQRHPNTIYTKLFVSYFENLDKILYLDSDTIIQQNLEELFQIELGRNIIAGVQMPYEKKKKQNCLLKEDENYICDGVVLFNLKKWKDLSIEEKCLAYIKRWNENPPMLSEGVLNYICRGKVYLLPPKYNLMGHMLSFDTKQIKKLFKITDYYSEIQLQEAKDTPAIVHFLAELYNRPWNRISDHPYTKEFRDYAKILGIKTTWSRQRLNKKTRLTKWIISNMPFPFFCLLYHIWHRELK